MSCPIPTEQLEQLKIFIEICKQSPNLLHTPQLRFFKDFIESFGGNLPEPSETAPPPKPQPQQAAPEPLEEEIVESEVELDLEGIITPHPDDEKLQTMGPITAEVDDDALEKSNERKREAIEHFGGGNYEEAEKSYTEAILLNPCSAMLYAKRGQTFLMQNKPKSCIRDCDRAIELNPDCAAAYKFRGRAHFLLADFLKAAEDLRFACKLDFDEQADAWLKLVTPNARKLEEHKRKYERLRLERQIRINKKRQQQQQQPNPPPPSFPTGGFQMPSNPMDMLTELMKDPALMASMQDPEVVAAISDISQNPMNFAKYKNNPKLAAAIEKLKSRLNPQGGEGSADIPNVPPPTADLDID